MTDKERLEEIKSVYEDYKGLQKKGDFKQADIALLYLSENHIDWLINRIEELEKQRNERTQLLNAEVCKKCAIQKGFRKNCKPCRQRNRLRTLENG